MRRGETGWEEGAQHYENNSFVSCSFLKVFHCPVGQSNKTSITEVPVSGRLKGGIRSARRVGEGPGQSLEACAREGRCQPGTSQGCLWRWGLWAHRGLRASLGHRAQQLEGEGDSAEDWCGPKGSCGGGLKAWGDNKLGFGGQSGGLSPRRPAYSGHVLSRGSRRLPGCWRGSEPQVSPSGEGRATGLLWGGHLHPLLPRCFTSGLHDSPGG